MNSRSTVLKAANMKWLVALAALDATLVLLLLAPSLVDVGAVAALRAACITALPVVVLLLIGVLSHNAKAVLVYWRLKDPLPGSEAFTKHATADARIDIKALAKNVGALPSDPREQNAVWYKLYRRVSGDPAVAEAHKLYLLYRDMAVMSLVLLPVVPATLWYAGASPGSQGITALIFLTQYLACAMAARHSGIRLVSNVLAIHSTTKVKAPST
ncbi:MAG: hypothetical protein IBJ04_18125 [Hydrogenophaga sp.]|uniref:hypothetical protein n=1 Tax=Hydrogenophaga sp. TaxID=1904254 RepID=UPI00257A924C|nr:hypothetical protein [Hydrogenophaga sp.]MBL0946237.1 hypothetical protein [Hydrogenophaga sp.]